MRSLRLLLFFFPTDALFWLSRFLRLMHRFCSFLSFATLAATTQYFHPATLLPLLSLCNSRTVTSFVLRFASPYLALQCFRSRTLSEPYESFDPPQKLRRLCPFISRSSHPRYTARMADAADLWESELGAFDIEVDDSAAAARRARIEASRRAAKGYTAKVEEPGVRRASSSMPWSSLGVY